MFDKVRGDYHRHRGIKDPAFWTLAVYRFGRWANGLPAPARFLAKKVYGVLFLGIEVLTGSTINCEAEIGEEFHLVHSGGIHIHPAAVIGDRVGVMHDVTIGNNMGRKGAPIIGNDVFIGTGAKVLGPVTIGDGAVIGANSLVISDVPTGTTAIGVPARIMRLDRLLSQAGSTGTVPTRTGTHGDTLSPMP